MGIKSSLSAIKDIYDSLPFKTLKEPSTGHDKIQPLLLCSEVLSDQRGIVHLNTHLSSQGWKEGTWL
jgi:hypothetical protein